MSEAELLLEADRRGLLSSDKKAMLDEARRRGLIKDALAPSHREAEDASMAALERNPPDIPVRSAVSEATGGMVNRGRSGS